MKIKNLFKKKDEKDLSLLEDMYDEKTIKRIIELLKEKPKTFSTYWSSSEFLYKSVRSRNGKIHISLDGLVITPSISYKTNDKYADEIIELIEPIFKRDLEILVETFDSE